MEEKVRRDVLLPQGFYASELKMDPSNFEVNENLQEEYLAGIEEYRDLREQEEAAVLEDGHRRLNGDNYADVRYRYVNVLFNLSLFGHSLSNIVSSSYLAHINGCAKSKPNTTSDMKEAKWSRLVLKQCIIE